MKIPTSPVPRRQLPLAKPDPSTLDEVESLYSFLRYYEPEGYPKSCKQLSDLDRPHRVTLDLDYHDGLLGSGWRLDIKVPREPDRHQQVELPPGFKADDLTHFSPQGKVALHGYNESQQRWEVHQYQLAHRPNWFTKLKPQLLLSSQQPLNGIEFDNQGQLLAANDQGLHRLTSTGLLQWHDFGSKVHDVSTLSNGAVVALVEGQGPTQRDLIYLEGSTAPQILPLPSRFEEVRSPDGQQSLVYNKNDRDCPLFARSQSEEFGVIFRPKEVPYGLPLGDKNLDPKTFQWSSDSRFCWVTPPKPSWALRDFRDTLLWDSQSRCSYILPGISQLECPEGGPLKLQPFDQSPLIELPREQLPDLELQPWYSKLWNTSVLSWTGGSSVSQRHRDGTCVPLEGSRTLNLRLNRDQSHLVAINSRQDQAFFWSVETGLPFQSPQGRHVYWDSQRDEVGHISEDLQVTVVPGSQLRQSPWYRESLQEEIVPPQAQQVVARESDGTVFNGLKFPKKTPTG